MAARAVLSAGLLVLTDVIGYDRLKLVKFTPQQRNTGYATDCEGGRKATHTHTYTHTDTDKVKVDPRTGQRPASGSAELPVVRPASMANTATDFAGTIVQTESDTTSNAYCRFCY